MKNIVRSVLFVIVLLLVGDLFMQVSARHDLDPKCYTFQGQGTGVPSAGGSGQPAGIFNSGMIDFDAYDSSHKFQACGEVNADGNLEISGWAWNTNLGDISFRCEAGLNFSVPCGVIEYGSSISNINGTDYLVGYAWGDNFGWLSLGCMDYDGDGLLENYQYGVVDNDRPGNRMACGSVEYGTEVSADGSLVGYGYAESVGRMNTTGTSIDWPVLDTDDGSDLDGDGIKDGTVVEGFPDDPLDPTLEMPEGRFTYTDADGVVRGYAYANGEDYYEIRVQLLEDDVPLTCDQAALRNPLMFLTHNGGEIFHDQIDNASPGAVSVTDFTCDGVDTYTARVTSLAPTGQAPNGDIPPYQTFTLENLNVVMEDFRGVTRSMDIPMGESLTFVPAIYIDSFQSKDANGDWQSLLYASRNTSVPVQFIGGRYRAGGQVPANEEIYIYGTYTPDLPASNPYTFYDDPTGDGPDLDADGLINPDLNSVNFSYDVGTNLLSPAVRGTAAGVNTASPYQRYVYAYSEDPDAPESQSNSASAKLRVEYTTVLSGVPVRYLTSEISAGATFNQFAQLRGNLRLDEGAFQEVVSRQVSAQCEGENCEKRAQTGLPSGEYLKSFSRERIQRILIEQFRGRSGPGSVKRVPGGTDIEITESTILTENRSIGSDNILYYKPSDGNDEPFNVVIVSAITDPDIEPTTIVCEGCDFYVNANVSDGISDPATKPTIKLGLIALKDPRITGDRKGGNVYIHSDVTETALHIYADGSFYSYSDRDQIDGEGIPQFAPLDPAQILKNQYTNYGRIRSNNTLGGSTLLPAITGEGERATTQALQYKARMQDLNFLRYAKTVQNADFNPDLKIEDNLNLELGPPYYWVNNIILSPSLGIQPQQDPRTVDNYPLAYGIVNFFDSSSSGLPIFEALSTVSR